MTFHGASKVPLFSTLSIIGRLSLLAFLIRELLGDYLGLNEFGNHPFPLLKIAIQFMD